jgi:hypothetical protein
LVRYPEDGNPDLWQERVLFACDVMCDWISITPDEDFDRRSEAQRDDLPRDGYWARSASWHQDRDCCLVHRSEHVPPRGRAHEADRGGPDHAVHRRQLAAAAAGRLHSATSRSSGTRWTRGSVGSARVRRRCCTRSPTWRPCSMGARRCSGTPGVAGSQLERRSGADAAVEVVFPGMTAYRAL